MHHSADASRSNGQTPSFTHHRGIKPSTVFRVTKLLTLSQEARLGPCLGRRLARHLEVLNRARLLYLLIVGDGNAGTAKGVGPARTIVSPGLLTSARRLAYFAHHPSLRTSFTTSFTHFAYLTCAGCQLGSLTRIDGGPLRPPRKVC